MSKRYQSAFDEIRTLLERDPRLTAKQIWNELTCWPVPSLRTIARFAQAFRLPNQLAANARPGDARSATFDAAAAFVKEKRLGTDEALTELVKQMRPSKFVRTDSSSEKEHPVAQKTTDEKLSEISDHLVSLHKKHDDMQAAHGALAGRLDKLESARETGVNDAAAATAVELAELRKRLPAELSQEDKNIYAEVQLRADAAHQAWNGRARAPQMGESLKDYRVALLAPLQKHSKKYAQSDLSLIADPAAMSTIEASIVADAIAASNCNDAPGQPLRKVTTMDDFGRRVTKFYGDPVVAMAGFMGHHTKFVKLKSMV